MSLMKTYKRFDLNFKKGKNCYLYDTAGNEYLDFVAGVAVNALGHCNEAMVKVIKDQAEDLIHISNLYYDDHQLALGKKLIDLSDHQSVFFCNSGTEAVEGALKIARKYGKQNNKNKILYMENSFHGRTLGALSVTGQEKYQKDFKPLLGAVAMVKFNDKKDFLNKMDDSVCGVIIEPIQGEGGIYPVDEAYLQFIKNECLEYGALLIFDEVQCGVGRTGKFFAYENFGVIPDVIAMAKGLGSGVPIGAFIANEKADVLTYGDHGCTFGGSPLMTAVSTKVVEIVSNPNFLADVNMKSEYLIEKLEDLKERYEFISDIRGIGLMLGVQLEIDVKSVVHEAIKEGLLIINAGNKTIRIVPPLTVELKDIDLFIEKFNKVLEKY